MDQGAYTYPPTLTEISQGVYMSRSGIYRHLGKLEGQGKIWRDEKRARGIRLLEEEHD
ncbi:MAG: LexA repressor [Anaerolineae bacterium]|nr:LexA repressor [Anaerolineae bacterium]